MHTVEGPVATRKAAFVTAMAAFWPKSKESLKRALGHAQPLK
jgi:hypothetical protein